MFFSHPRNKSKSNFGDLICQNGIRVRTALKRKIQAYVEKMPDVDLKEVRSWIVRGNQSLQEVEVRPRTLRNFISYQFLKFKSRYDVTKHVGGYGRRRISKDKEKKIKSCLNKKHSGTAHQIGVSFSTHREECSEDEWAACISQVQDISVKPLAV